VTAAELIRLLQALPPETRVVVPSHRAFRDTDLVPVNLVPEGAGPGAHARAPGPAAGTEPGAVICTRHRAAELRDEPDDD
jgi:hypothetical protein